MTVLVVWNLTDFAQTVSKNEPINFSPSATRENYVPDTSQIHEKHFGLILLTHIAITHS